MQWDETSRVPFSETLSFDYASTSNDKNINQQDCYSNMHNSAHNTLQDYLRSHDDRNTVHRHFPTRQTHNLNGWSMGVHNSIVPQNHNSHRILLQTSNDAAPHDLNTSAEILDHDSDDRRILETPPVPFSTYSHPRCGSGSGSSNLLDGHRMSGKRKSLKRNIGQCSKGERSSNFDQTQGNVCQAIPSGKNASSSSSNNQSQNVCGISPGDVAIGNPFAQNSNGSSHSSLGNYHSRSPHLADSIPVSLPLTRISPQLISSSLLAPDHLLGRSLGSQSLPSGLHASSRRTQNPSRWTEGPISRHGHSSSSRERIEVPGEAPNPISLPRNTQEHHPTFIPTDNLRNSVQNSTASSSRVQLSRPNWVSHQNHPQFLRILTELVRRPLLASFGSDNGGQSSNSLVPSEALPSGASSRGHRVLSPRSRLLLDGQLDGAISLPHSMQGLASSSEGRSWLISEQIPNVLELMRGGDNLHFEDVVLLYPSMLFGITGTHDRHRDMRLDIDNMSYEELLALEERIGDVNTGLSEEIILNRLKKKKYLSITMNAQMEEEPCSVCQEEYNDGEDVGMLDCGHEFHSSCVKQWLVHKNLCPICKTTALSK